MDPAVGEDVGIREPEPAAELHPEPAEDLRHDLRAVGDDEDEIALVGGRLVDDRARQLVGQELRDGALDLAASLEGEICQALRTEPLGSLGQLVDLTPGRGRPCPGRRSP